VSGLFGPEPPDPRETAAAQTGSNVSTAVANAFLGNVNQKTPEGGLNYNVTGNYGWTDPSTGQTYQIPTFTAEQTLTPEQQAIRDQQSGAKFNLAEMANIQSGQLGNMLSNPFDPEKGNFDAAAYLQAYPDVAAYAQQIGWDPAKFAAHHYRVAGQTEGRNAGFTQMGQAPGAGNVDWLKNVPNATTEFGGAGDITRSFDTAGQQQGTFGDAGDITRTYGPSDNFSADRGRVEEALYGRLHPQLSEERRNIETRLADQGIRYGSAAYQEAMDDYNRQANDARLAVTQAGGQEQQRMMDMAAQRAGFQNAAQKQAYEQALGRGTFANTAQQAQFAENQAAAGFGNQAQQQAYQQARERGTFFNAGVAQQQQKAEQTFNAANAARQQYMGEQYQRRNQPLNEISALMSGSQVSGPNFINTNVGKIPTTDIASLINNNYQQESQNFNSLMGGIFGMIGGLGGGALRNPMITSDRRVKKDIERMGTTFAAGPDGKKPLPIYEYSYKADPTGERHVGPMAQDVEKIDKGAVRNIGGVKHIDVTRMGSILRAA